MVLTQLSHMAILLTSCFTVIRLSVRERKSLASTEICDLSKQEHTCASADNQICAKALSSRRISEKGCNLFSDVNF